MRTWKMKWIVIGLCFIFSGCATYTQTVYQTIPVDQTPKYTSMEQADKLAGVDRSQQYKEGFMNGCDSGYVTGGDYTYSFKKDAARFVQDEEYKKGWNHGYNICGNYRPITTYRTTYYAGPYYRPYYYRPYYRPWYYWPRYRFHFGYGGHHRHGYGSHFRFGLHFGHHH